MFSSNVKRDKILAHYEKELIKPEYIKKAKMKVVNDFSLSFQKGLQKDSIMSEVSDESIHNPVVTDQAWRLHQKVSGHKTLLQKFKESLEAHE